MKTLFKSVALKIYLTLILIISGMNLFAQDGGSGSSTSVTTTHSESQTWYTQPWVWIVGGAVFVLLLIALLRGNSSEKVTISKTERTEV